MTPPTNATAQPRSGRDALAPANTTASPFMFTAAGAHRLLPHGRRHAELDGRATRALESALGRGAVHQRRQPTAIAGAAAIRDGQTNYRAEGFAGSWHIV